MNRWTRVARPTRRKRDLQGRRWCRRGRRWKHRPSRRTSRLLRSIRASGASSSVTPKERGQRTAREVFKRGHRKSPRRPRPSRSNSNVNNLNVLAEKICKRSAATTKIASTVASRRLMRVRPSSGRGMRRGAKIGSRRKRRTPLRRGSGRVRDRNIRAHIRCISKGGVAKMGQAEKRRRRGRRRLRHVLHQARPHPPEIPRGSIHPMEGEQQPTLAPHPVLGLEGTLLDFHHRIEMRLSWSHRISLTVLEMCAIRAASG